MEVSSCEGNELCEFVVLDDSRGTTKKIRRIE